MHQTIPLQDTINYSDTQQVRPIVISLSLTYYFQLPQEIDEVSKGSEASIEGVDNAEFEYSDNNAVDQSSNQEIEDIDEDSTATNDAENTVSFDDTDGSDLPDGA